MICDTCGREITEGAKFCTYCGAPVQLKPPEEPTLPAEPVLPAELEIAPVAEPEVAPAPEPEVVAVVEQGAAPAAEPEAAPIAEPEATPIAEPEAAPSAPQGVAQPEVAAVVEPEAAPPAPQGVVQQDAPQSTQSFEAPQPSPSFGAPNAAQPFGAPQPTQPFGAPGAPQPYGAPDAAQSFGAPAPQAGQPYGAPQSAPYGAPQQAAYDATYAQQAGQPTEPPKKSKAWIIVLVIVGVLVLCCVGVSVGGYVLYQRALEATTVTSINTPPSIPTPTPEPTPNITIPLEPPSNIPAISNGVLVDNSDLTVTLELGSGKFSQVDGWYVMDCTVENKTDKKLAMYLDYETQVVGLDEAYSDVTIWPEGDEFDFLPKTKVDGLMLFLSADKGETPTALWGTLVVYDADTYNTIGEYQVYLSKL